MCKFYTKGAGVYIIFFTEYAKLQNKGGTYSVIRTVKVANVETEIHKLGTLYSLFDTIRKLFTVTNSFLVPNYAS